MRSIKSKAQTLEARIAEAESRTSGHGVSDEVLRAYERVATILACFVSDGRHPQPENVLRCLLERGIPEGEATRYAGMTFDMVRDELMADPALSLE